MNRYLLQHTISVRELENAACTFRGNVTLLYYSFLISDILVNPTSLLMSSCLCITCN